MAERERRDDPRARAEDDAARAHERTVEEARRGALSLATARSRPSSERRAAGTRASPTARRLRRPHRSRRASAITCSGRACFARWSPTCGSCRSRRSRGPVRARSRGRQARAVYRSPTAPAVAPRQAAVPHGRVAEADPCATTCSRRACFACRGSTHGRSRSRRCRGPARARAAGGRESIPPANGAGGGSRTGRRRAWARRRGGPAARFRGPDGRRARLVRTSEPVLSSPMTIYLRGRSIARLRLQLRPPVRSRSWIAPSKSAIPSCPARPAFWALVGRSTLPCPDSHPAFLRAPRGSEIATQCRGLVFSCHAARSTACHGLDRAHPPHPRIAGLFSV